MSPTSSSPKHWWRSLLRLAISGHTFDPEYAVITLNGSITLGRPPSTYRVRATVNALCLIVDFWPKS